MKKLNENDAAAQGAPNIAETKNNISYIVTYYINHIDKDRKCSTVVENQKTFSEDRPIDARKKAVNHAYRICQDADTEGKLYKKYLSTPAEALLNNMRNIYIFYITIEVVDEKWDSKEIISEGDFCEYSEECFEYLQAELMWYREYGHDVDDWVIPMTNFFGIPCEILDLNMIDLAMHYSLEVAAEAV